MPKDMNISELDDAANALAETIGDILASVEQATALSATDRTRIADRLAEAWSLADRLTDALDPCDRQSPLFGTLYPDAAPRGCVVIPFPCR